MLKLRLFHKIFLANLAVLVLLFVVFLSINYFNHRSMAAHIEKVLETQQRSLLAALSKDLAQYYALHRSWQAFIDDPQSWRQFVEQKIHEALIIQPPAPAIAEFPPFPPVFAPPPAPSRGAAKGPFAAPPPPMFSKPPQGQAQQPPAPPLHALIASRLVLYSATQQVLIEEAFSASAAERVSKEIVFEDQLVGVLSLAKAEQALMGMEQLLPKYQFSYVGALALCGLVLAGVVSFYFTKHLAAPINKLSQGTIALAQRQFDTKIRGC